MEGFRFSSTLIIGTGSTTSKEEHFGTNGMKENANAACKIVKASLAYRCDVVIICHDMPDFFPLKCIATVGSAAKIYRWCPLRIRFALEA